MPTVTSIKTQKKKEARFNIFLDGKFAFSLPAEALAKAGLHTGQELSPEQVASLIKESDFTFTFEKVLKFLSFRPRSEFEIDEYMLRQNIGEETRKMVMQKLEQLKLIDDEAFAKWWLDQRSVFRPEGRRLVGFELKRKGIAKEIIEELMTEGRPRTADVFLAEKLAEKRLTRLKKLPEIEAEKKIWAYLARKGFSFEVIKEAVAKTLKKE